MVDSIKLIEAEAEQEQSFDTSDKEQVNKSRKKASRTRADRLRFVQVAMQHEEGRAWFHDILTFCKVFMTPFNEDQFKTAFNCGQLNIGLRILDDIQEAAPDKYISMINESKRTK